MKNIGLELNSIGIFGFGNMGQAIFDLLKEQKNYKFFINDSIFQRAQDLRKMKLFRAKWSNNLVELIRSSDLLFICVKPQNFRELEPLEAKNKTIISIMAGITLKEINQKFKGAKVIRTMPNLPLQIGEGILAWYYQKNIFTKKEINFIQELLSFFGELVLLKKESDIHSITAITGCGPAYVFAFINALIKSAIKLGFSREEAKLIVDGTISGSFNYYQNQNLELEKLITKVSSKKGITEVALKELNLKEFYNTWQKVTKKAEVRSKELSK